MDNHFECIVKKHKYDDSSIKEVWNGTFAVDEFSLESPITHGYCAASLARQIELSKLYSPHNRPLKKENITGSNSLSKKDQTIIYIASDSNEASLQIKSTITQYLKASSMHHVKTIMTPPGCHVDYNHTTKCIKVTILYWFALAVSDDYVLQSYNYTTENNEVTNISLASSSFSRYAMIYGLQNYRKVHYYDTANIKVPPLMIQGDVCKSDQTEKSRHRDNLNSRYSELDKVVSKLPQGNWVCTGGLIY